MREAAIIAYACDLCKLTFDFLNLKVSESPVTWPISMSSLVFLGLSVLDLGPMYSSDRQTYVRRHRRIIA